MEFREMILRSILCASIALEAGCLQSASDSPAPGRDKALPVGDARVSIHTAQIGSLAKSAVVAKSSRTSAIELARLVLELSAAGQPSVRDTLPLSGSGDNTVSKIYPGLAANLNWTLTAQTLDRNGIIIHSGSTEFPVLIGQTADARLSLAPKYSTLSAGFFPITGDISKVELAVDGEVRAESTFTPGSTGDTVRLLFNYLETGMRHITLNVYGGSPPILAYSGDSIFEIAAGRRSSGKLRLRGYGNASMTVSLASAGELDLVGEMDAESCIPSPGPGWSESFDGGNLDSAWLVWSYSGARHNSQTSPANHFTLANGALRYVVDPMTTIRDDHQPWFDGTWYWYDPGEELTRPISGTHWLVETKVEWYVPLVVNAAGFDFSVRLGTPSSGFYDLTVQRYSNDDTRSGMESDHNVLTVSAGKAFWTQNAPLQTNIVRWARLERDGERVSISLSEDGISWTELVTDRIPTEFQCASQQIFISGTSWFSPGGSYADYSEVVFTRLD